MVNIIEDELPSEYYTNMLSVFADLKILYIFFKMKFGSLHKHFQKLGIDMAMIALPCFLTLFTNCSNSLTDIIIDHFFISGSIALIKTMLLYFSYMKKELLKIDDLRKLFLC